MNAFFPFTRLPLAEPARENGVMMMAAVVHREGE